MTDLTLGLHALAIVLWIWAAARHRVVSMRWNRFTVQPIWRQLTPVGTRLFAAGWLLNWAGLAITWAQR